MEKIRMGQGPAIVRKGFHQKKILFFIHLNRILPVDGLIVKNYTLTTPVVEAKTKKGALLHLWFAPKRKKGASPHL